MIKRLCVIGVGLIGGSLARALRAAGQVHEVVGCGRGLPNLQRALELGVIDRIEQDPARAVRGADMIVIGVPLGATEAIFAKLHGHVDAGAVITDVGSVKTSVVEAAQRVFGEVPANLVPGHPIAGTEQSGVEASFAELFRQRRVILTPLGETADWALTRVRAMWQATGAEVVEMEVRHHDEVLAGTSHLPHMLAYCLVDTLARLKDNDEMFQYAAGGFRDFTRIASSSPEMWRDICLANREALGDMLVRFVQDLSELNAALEEGDGDELFAIFARAKSARDRYVDRRGGNGSESPE